MEERQGTEAPGGSFLQGAMPLRGPVCRRAFLGAIVNALDAFFAR